MSARGCDGEQGPLPSQPIIFALGGYSACGRDEQHYLIFLTKVSVAYEDVLLHSKGISQL